MKRKDIIVSLLTFTLATLILKNWDSIKEFISSLF
jgi:hypothetical protein